MYSQHSLLFSHALLVSFYIDILLDTFQLFQHLSPDQISWHCERSQPCLEVESSTACEILQPLKNRNKFKTYPHSMNSLSAGSTCTYRFRRGSAACCPQVLLNSSCEGSHTGSKVTPFTTGGYFDLLTAHEREGP